MKWTRGRRSSVRRDVGAITRVAVSVPFILIGAGVITSTSGADSTTTSTVASTTSTTVPPTTTTTVRLHKSLHENPFACRGLAAFLATRKDDVTAALFNVTSDVTYLYWPGIRQMTASMVKIDILAELLYEDQMRNVTISKRDDALTTRMIELSDN